MNYYYNEKEKSFAVTTNFKYNPIPKGFVECTLKGIYGIFYLRRYNIPSYCINHLKTRFKHYFLDLPIKIQSNPQVN